MIIKKVVRWAKNNPSLTSLIVFIVVQTIFNAVLVMRVIQLEEALRELVFKLFPPYPTYRF